MHASMRKNLQCRGRLVGAGDCFTAAYAVGLLNDMSPEKALRFASGNLSFVNVNVTLLRRLSGRKMHSEKGSDVESTNKRRDR